MNLLIKRLFFLQLLFFMVQNSFCRLSPHTKIAYWSTWNLPCGVAVYTKHIINALRYQGYITKVYHHNLNVYNVYKRAKIDKIDILNIQYIPGLMAPIDKLVQLIKSLNMLGVKVIITVHHDDPELNRLIPYVKLFIYHKKPKYLKNITKTTVLPMGVPVFSTKKTKNELKQQFGYSPNSKIITTTGFLLPNKELAKVLQAFAPFLKANPRYVIQLLTPFNGLDSKTGKIEYAKILKVIKNNALEKQVVCITRFIPQQEFNERISISDVGYQWFNINTPATSSAAKEFIATQVPLVVPNSTHFHDLNSGVIKTPMYNIQKFIEKIIELVENNEHNLLLRQELNKKYEKLNYRSLIIKHLDLFESITSNQY